MALPKFKLSSHLPVLIGFFLTISIALTVIVLQQQQETRSRAAGECLISIADYANKQLKGTCSTGFCYVLSKGTSNLGYSCILTDPAHAHQQPFCYRGICQALPAGDTACTDRGGQCGSSCRGDQTNAGQICGDRAKVCCIDSCRRTYNGRCSTSACKDNEINKGPGFCAGGTRDASCCVPKTDPGFFCYLGGKRHCQNTSCPDGIDMRLISQACKYCCPNKPLTQNPGGGCRGDACHIGKKCTPPQGEGTCRYRDSYKCTGTWVRNYCPGSTNVVCCVPPKTTAKTQLAIPKAFLHIIGKAGDSIKEGEAGGGNPDPDHETRDVIINITDQNNNPKVTNKTATLTFDSTLGAFKTTTPIDLGNLPTGSYKVTIKMPMSLPLTVDNVTLTSGKSTDLPTVYLVTGDIKDDGKLDMLDWNILRDCFSDIEDPSSCSDETKKLKADITDDGDVNHPDVNVWIRECKVHC